MTRSTTLLGMTGLLVAAGFLLAIGASPRALAKGKAEAHLRYATTYADAVAQARARNTVVFVSFHKDK